jgi:hypothetical protein
VPRGDGWLGSGRVRSDQCLIRISNGGGLTRTEGCSGSGTGVAWGWQNDSSRRKRRGGGAVEEERAGLSPSISLPLLTEAVGAAVALAGVELALFLAVAVTVEPGSLGAGRTTAAGGREAVGAAVALASWSDSAAGGDGS